MSGAIAETQSPARACAQCGYDLSGLGSVGGVHAPTCPECGAVAGSWRDAYAAPWLVTSSLRLLAWGLPSLVAMICLTRFVDHVRGLPQSHGLVLYSEAFLLYALPLAACAVGVGLLAAAAPGGWRERAPIIGLAAFTIACAGAALADLPHFREYLVAVGPTRTISYNMDLGMGAFAGRTGILATGALGICCLSLLGRLGSELGWSWFASWRTRLTILTAIVLVVTLGLREIVQVLAVGAAQGSAMAGFIPATAPRTWMDPLLLGVCGVVA